MPDAAPAAPSPAARAQRLGALRRLARSDFARYGLLVFASTSLANALGYFFHFFISRRLGVEAYGTLSALLATLVLASLPAAILTIVVVKYAAEFRAVGDDARIKALLLTVTASMSALGGAAFIIGVVASGAIGGYLHIADRPAIVATVGLIAFQMLGPVLRGITQGVEDFTSYSLSMLIEAVAKAVLGTAFVYAGYGVEGAIAGWLVGSLVSIVYTFALLWRRYGASAAGPLFIDFRRLALMSAGVALSTILLASMQYTDQLLVKHYFSAEQAGLYSAASLAGKMLLFFVGFVPTIILPMASARAASGGRPLPIFLQGVGVLVLLAGSGLFVFAKLPALVVGTLAGAKFAAAGPLVFPFGVAMVLLAVINAVANYKMAIHRFDFLVPLALVAVGEIVAMGVAHSSPGQVVGILIVGNAVALATCLYRIGAPLLVARTSEVEAAA